MTDGSGRRPNLILVTIDAARVDRFSCFGYARQTTPFLDELVAGSAARFERAFSPAPWTVPAFGSLFTGRFPCRHGVSRAHPYLDCPYLTLAEELGFHGYETFGVSNSSWISSATQFDRGFDEFFQVWQLLQSNVDIANARLRGLFSEDGRGAGLLRLLGGGNLLQKAVNSVYGRFVYKRGDYGAARVNRRFSRWLTQRDDSRPFFAFIYYLEPHLKYRPPKRLARRFLPPGLSYREALRVNQDAWAYIAGEVEMTDADLEILGALYDAEIAYTDERIRDLFATLEAAGGLDDTVVAITADHGEHLGEHGLLDHQYSLSDTLLRVPLILFDRRRFQNGPVFREIVQSFDLFPTLLGLAGARDEVLSRADGDSLLPEQLSERRRDFALAEYPEPQPPVDLLRRLYPGFDGSELDRGLRALRTDRFKLVVGTDGSVELYDVSRDPGETVNVASSHPEVVSRLSVDLEAALGPLRPPRGQPDDDLDPDVKARLQALGYLS